MAVFIRHFDATRYKVKQYSGGAGGIRTLDRALQPYNGLANRRLQPLGHSSVTADMPEAAASRKRADLGPANSRSFSDVRTPYLGPRRIRAAESQPWPWAACASCRRLADSGNARFPDFSSTSYWSAISTASRFWIGARGNRCAAIPENVIGQHFARY